MEGDIQAKLRDILGPINFETLRYFCNHFTLGIPLTVVKNLFGLTVSRARSLVDSGGALEFFEAVLFVDLNSIIEDREYSWGEWP